MVRSLGHIIALVAYEAAIWLLALLALATLPLALLGLCMLAPAASVLVLLDQVRWGRRIYLLVRRSLPAVAPRAGTSVTTP